MKRIVSMAVMLVMMMPMFSQIVDDPYTVFNHKVFVNAGNKYPITGIWSKEKPSEVSLMSIFHRQNGSNKVYIFLRNEEECNIWINNLKEMKDLFYKYDSIAIENNVTSKIEKNVSERFSFKGYYGEGVALRADVKPITPQKTTNACSTAVLYTYENGHSYMILYLLDYYLNRSFIVWKFESENDFDEIIRALNWSDFESVLNEQVQKYTDEQDAIKNAQNKQKKEQSLFD